MAETVRKFIDEVAPPRLVASKATNDLSRIVLELPPPQPKRALNLMSQLLWGYLNAHRPPAICIETAKSFGVGASELVAGWNADLRTWKHRQPMKRFGLRPNAETDLIFETEALIEQAIPHRADLANLPRVDTDALLQQLDVADGRELLIAYEKLASSHPEAKGGAEFLVHVIRWDTEHSNAAVDGITAPLGARDVHRFQRRVRDRHGSRPGITCVRTLDEGAAASWRSSASTRPTSIWRF